MSGVASISDYRRSIGPKRDSELKRLALQLTVQLPEDPKEGERVVRHMETLVRAFLADPGPI